MSIRVEGLFKRFGGHTAVNGLSFTIEDGEFFALLGPSGCGKTTTLRMIAGLEMPSEGKIFIHDRDVTYAEPRHRDIAMAFQDFGLYPHLSVFDNIAFPLRVRKVDPAERKRKVEETAEMMGLTRLLHKRPAQCSGGERQRVSLARALVRSPRVFLMDEPLCNLDAKMRATMRTEIKKLVSELGITTVYVTHDQIEAMAMADRIAVMSRGEMVQIGSPLEIYDQPKARFVAEFIGSPPMNLVEATVGSDRRLHAHPQYLADTVAPEQLQRVLNGAIVPGSKILVGVRPEHIRIDADPAASGAEARVELIEPLGQQTNVYLQLGDARLIAITDRPHFHTGDTVRIQVTPDKLHLINEGAHVDVHGSASAAAQLRQGDTRMAAH